MGLLDPTWSHGETAAVEEHAEQARPATGPQWCLAAPPDGDWKK